MMANKLKILIIFGVTLANYNALAAKKEILYCTGAVQGTCVSGDVTVGAAGDKLSADTQNVLVQNLREIKTTKNAEIVVPSSGQIVVSFTPTKGTFANKQIKLLFYVFNIDNMPKGLSNPKIYTEATDAKTRNPWISTMLKVYSQLPGQEQWTELLTSFNEKSVTEFKPTIMVDSEAKLTYHPQQYEDETGKSVTPKPIIFDLKKPS